MQSMSSDATSTYMSYAHSHIAHTWVVQCVRSLLQVSRLCYAHPGAPQGRPLLCSSALRRSCRSCCCRW